MPCPCPLTAKAPAPAPPNRRILPCRPIGNSHPHHGLLRSDLQGESVDTICVGGSPGEARRRNRQSRSHQRPRRPSGVSEYRRRPRRSRKTSR